MNCQPLRLGARAADVFRAFLTCCFALLLACIVPTRAALATPPTQQAVTLYQGQGVDENLPGIPKAIVKGDIDWDDTYFTGLGYYHPLPTPRILQDLFDILRIPTTGTGLEAIVVKHYGLQNNWEVDLAYMVRFPQIEIQQLTVRIGAGIGLSYAFSTPSYEDGPLGDPDARYRLQNYDAIEIEWGVASVPQVGLVTRIHHRSGMYGVIAPRRVGSNFLTLGLRYAF